MLKLLSIATVLITGFYLLPAKISTMPKAPLQTAVSATSIAVLPNDDPQPEELGQVHWLRDLKAGQAEAAKTGKPLLLLFQEVPGCSNCTHFGNNTLSHPLIVEAIETYFVPVCIYNNRGGQDGAALKTFDEPAWNNPVVRIVRADYKDVVLRMPDFRTSLPLVNGLRRALELTGTAVPRYLELLEEELEGRAAGLQTATFSMYCFWAGEGTFGAIPGVIETAPGFQDGHEVVRVTFNPAIVSRADLEANTRPKGTTACQKNEGFRADNEPKYYLSKTDYRFVPMTSLQASRANSLVGQGQAPDILLSARQLALLQTIRTNPSRNWKSMIGRTDLPKAWAEIRA
ncbi:MAG: VPGUxxT family thioredoxin-like (seleno)protein, type 2 [Saprospiraceae bacterium]